MLDVLRLSREGGWVWLPFLPFSLWFLPHCFLPSHPVQSPSSLTYSCLSGVSTASVYPGPLLVCPTPLACSVFFPLLVAPGVGLCQPFVISLWLPLSDLVLSQWLSLRVLASMSIPTLDFTLEVHLSPFCLPVGHIPVGVMYAHEVQQHR